MVDGALALVRTMYTRKYAIMAFQIPFCLPFVYFFFLFACHEIVDDIVHTWSQQVDELSTTIDVKVRVKPLSTVFLIMPVMS